MNRTVGNSRFRDRTVRTGARTNAFLSLGRVATKDNGLQQSSRFSQIAVPPRRPVSDAMIVASDGKGTVPLRPAYGYPSLRSSSAVIQWVQEFVQETDRSRGRPTAMPAACDLPVDFAQLPLPLWARRVTVLKTVGQHVPSRTDCFVSSKGRRVIRYGPSVPFSSVPSAENGSAGSCSAVGLLCGTTSGMDASITRTA